MLKFDDLSPEPYGFVRDPDRTDGWVLDVEGGTRVRLYRYRADWDEIEAEIPSFGCTSHEEPEGDTTDEVMAWLVERLDDDGLNMRNAADRNEKTANRIAKGLVPS